MVARPASIESPGGGEFSPGRFFVGRARELDELRTALADATRGRGGLILLSGEPGIGKTRLAEEFGAHARAAGAVVIWGRSFAGGGAPALSPWVQVIRSVCESVAAAELVAHLAGGAAYVAGIVPEVAAKLGSARPAPASLGSEHARFQLFDAVTSFLVRTAAARPLVVVLDDLPWVDRASLLLLEFLARELHEARMLVIGTYREGDVGTDAQNEEFLASLSRGARSIPLRGLSEADVGLLVERAWGRKPDALLVAAVYRSTDGNPFFVDEIVRLLAAEGIWALRPGKALPIPAGVRAAIRLRLGQLPRAVRDILSIGAVVGRELDVLTLARAAGLGAREVLAGLATAVDRGLLARPSTPDGPYAFAHAVIRETLYDDLPPTTRPDLHRRVGEALEAIHAADLEAHVAELAFHFHQADLAGGAEKALDYAKRAGEHALRLLAYEEAADHYERAAALAARQHADPQSRCELLLALGDAEWRAGEGARARDAFVRAAEIARSRGDAGRFARAALGIGMRAETGVVDDLLVGLLESARAALGDGDSVARAKVLARLAMALYFSSSAEERRNALAAEAVAMAKRLGDQGTLAFALICRLFVLWGPGSVEERLALADEVIRLAQEAGNTGVALQGRSWKILSLLEAGELRAVDREIDAYERDSARTRLPHNVWYLALVRSARAFLVGDFVTGERLASEAVAVRGERGQHANAAMFYGAQLFTLRREQGRLAELGPLLAGFATHYGALPIWRCSVALFHCEQGDWRAARREFEALAACDFAVVLPDGNRPPALALLAETCHLLGDSRRAAVLYQLLLPFAARNIVVATSAICYGPAARYLGLLATALGRWEDAEGHFADAAAMCERMGARPWAAHTERDWALMLRARGGPEDAERAAALLSSALSTARALGMKLLEEKILAATASAPTVRGEPMARLVPDEASPLPASEPSRLQRVGGHWLIAHQGVVFRLKDSKGLRTLAHLLHQPGIECHVLELVALAEGGNESREGSLAPAGRRAVGLGHAGALLDPQAKAAYRARLADLRNELAEAERLNDVGRAEKARREIEFLRAELARAVGLGGRDRHAAAAAERARLNVTRALRGAVDKIGDFSPALRAHLQATLRTGTYCSYRPGPASEVAWVLDPD